MDDYYPEEEEMDEQMLGEDFEASK